MIDISTAVYGELRACAAADFSPPSTRSSGGLKPDAPQVPTTLIDVHLFQELAS